MHAKIHHCELFFSLNHQHYRERNYPDKFISSSSDCIFYLNEYDRWFICRDLRKKSFTNPWKCPFQPWSLDRFQHFFFHDLHFSTFFYLVRVLPELHVILLRFFSLTICMCPSIIMGHTLITCWWMLLFTAVL